MKYSVEQDGRGGIVDILVKKVAKNVSLQVKKNKKTVKTFKLSY